MHSEVSVKTCCLLLDQYCKKYGIERREIPYGDTDILESYDFYKDNERIGSISYQGIISLGNMNFPIESLEAWFKWLEMFYPVSTFENALQKEISRVSEQPYRSFFTQNRMLEVTPDKVEHGLGVNKEDRGLAICNC